MFLVAYWVPAALLGTRSTKIKKSPSLLSRHPKYSAIYACNVYSCLNQETGTEKKKRNRHCTSVSYKTPLVGVNKKSLKSGILFLKLAGVLEWASTETLRRLNWQKSKIEDSKVRLAWGKARDHRATQMVLMAATKPEIRSQLHGPQCKGCPLSPGNHSCFFMRIRPTPATAKHNRLVFVTTMFHETWS